MQDARLIDAYIAVVQGTSPEKWSRYCEIAAEISGAEPDKAEGAGRNLLMRRHKIGEDTLEKSLEADPEYLEIFFESHELEIAFVSLFVQAMRSNEVTVIAFDPDDITHPIKIDPDMMDVVMAPSEWRVEWGHSKIKFEKGRWFEVRVTLKGALDTPRGGRPTVADWDAIEELLRREIKKRGPPSRDNEKGWWTKADVFRWMEAVLEDRKESAAPSTIRDHVNAVLKGLK